MTAGAESAREDLPLASVTLLFNRVLIHPPRRDSGREKLNIASLIKIERSLPPPATPPPGDGHAYLRWLAWEDDGTQPTQSLRMFYMCYTVYL